MSDLIFSYTRREALDDGVLMDIPLNALAHEAGIKYHCAMTAALFGSLDPMEAERKKGQDLKGRLWDMLTIFKVKAKQEGGQIILFDFLVRKSTGMETVRVKAHCGPGDDAEPVITFMFENED